MICMRNQKVCKLTVKKLDYLFQVNLYNILFYWIKYTNVWTDK